MSADALVRSASVARPVHVEWLVGAAIVFQFAALPILWQESGIPSIIWTGLSACLLALSALAMWRYTYVERATAWLTVAFVAAYVVFCGLSYYLQPAPSAARLELLPQNARTMLLCLLLFFLGAAARTCRSYRALGLAALALAAYVLSNPGMFELEAMYQAQVEESRNLNYQALGDAFAICSLAVAPRIRKLSYLLAWIAVSLVVMFIIPSRSAALFGAVGLGLALVLNGNRASWIAIAAVGGLGAAAYASGLLQSLFQDTRFETVFSGEEDGSWEVRQEIMDRGMAVLHSRPFTGEWAFQVGEFNVSGYYVHNALDIWIQSGILPFLLFLGIWALILRGLVRTAERVPRVAGETLPVLVYAALSWAFSRNIGFVVLFFCLGFASAAYARATATVRRRPA